ncbi:MAG: LamG-like jellyroll fold domain-containing protein [Pseudomonadota bacterium]
MTGRITGQVLIAGDPAVRNIVGISAQQQPLDDGMGGTVLERIIVGEAESGLDGNYTLDTGDFLDEVIVVVLEDYGTEWLQNEELVVGQRIRPTQPNQNGYIYEVTVAGNAGVSEPTWIVPTPSTDTMNVGAATVRGLPLYWSLGHAPLVPEDLGGGGPVTDPNFASVQTLIPFTGLNEATDSPRFGSQASLLDPAIFNGAVEISNGQTLFGQNMAFLPGGAGDYIGSLRPSFGGSATFNFTSTFTAEMFFYPTAANFNNSFQMLMSCSYSGSNPNGIDGWALQIQNAGGFQRLRIIGRNGSTTVLGPTVGGTDLDVNTMYHVAVTHNGGNWRVWLNGLLEIDIVQTSNVRSFTDRRFLIGAEGQLSENGSSPNNFSGYVGQWRHSDILRYTDPFPIPSDVFPTSGP